MHAWCVLQAIRWVILMSNGSPISSEVILLHYTQFVPNLYPIVHCTLYACGHACMQNIHQSQVAVSEIHLVLNLRNTEHFLIVVLNAVSYIHIYMNPNLPAAAVDTVLYGKRWPSC